MVARAVPPEDARLTNTDELGLTDGYNRMRNSVRTFIAELNLDAGEFDQEFPPLMAAQAPHRIGMPDIQMGTSRAKNAATLLRSLAGYVEGLIEAVVLDQEISLQQIEAAREAARQPPGFR
jgi:hypothetical protein